MLPIRVPAIELLFRPASIAVIGASPDASRPATRAIRGLLRGGAAVRVYPINPKYDDVEGLPCYASFADLPEVPDLVVVALRSEAVVDAISAACEFGTRAFMVFSSGFSEVGQHGIAQENRLRALAQERGLAVLGPNSLGLINLVDGVHCSFSSFLQHDDIKVGRVALITQSGAVGAYVSAMADARGFGFSHIVSTGNEVAVEAADIAIHLLGEPDVEAVAMYVEGIRSGERLRECFEMANRLGKRVVVLRAGDSDSGRQAAKSHTGAMAGSTRVSDAVFTEYGVTHVVSPEDLLTVCQLVEGHLVPEGSGLGILTVSGGGGVLVADAAARWNMPVPRLAPETRSTLSELLPPWAGVGNPTDVTATVLLDESGCLRQSITVMSDDPSIDVVVIFMGAGGASAAHTARQFVDAVRSAKKPCLVIWLGLPADAEHVLRDARIPYFQGVEECIRPLSALVGTQSPKRRDDEPEAQAGEEHFAEVNSCLKAIDGDLLNEVESKHILAGIGLDCLPERQFVPVDRKSDLYELAGTLTYPVVVKLVARRVVHKHAIGGVVLGVRNSRELLQASDQVIAAGTTSVGVDGVEGVLIEAMADSGVEIIVGAAHDPTFGYCLMVGPGGTLAELIDDVVVILPPASPRKVLDRITGSRLEKLLIGRGSTAEPEFDVDALCVILSHLSRYLASADPSLLKEMDLNPIIVHRRDNGATIADCLITR